MNPDKKQSTTNDRLIIVSSEITATVSNRVSFNSQNIVSPHFIGDDINFHGMVNTNLPNSSRGIHLLFPKSIKTGTYPLTDNISPFKTFSYYENGANAVTTQSFIYNVKSGIVEVEAKSNTADLLSYVIDFEVTCENPTTGSLNINGTATYIVLLVPYTAK
jgi:hypothetical protein